jgi:isocitrate dehydrogenase kinase/phosphatase
MQQCSDEALEPCLIDYGNAIKELAAANIFPGDMLYKNFGVSRQGRVVFYDYDEIEYMTTCRFREVPTAPHDEDELSSEPWYPVGKYDVFPEEFPRFLLADSRVRRIMMQHHPDLFTAHFWDALKTRIASGQVESVFPYPQEIRFTVGNGAENILPRFIRQAVSSL